MYGTIDLNMLETKRSTLNLLDILILAIIFFGLPIWQSVSMYLTSMQDSVQTGFDFNTISDSMQWISIAQEIILLGVAALYLWLRKFDFKILNLKVTKWTLPICLGLIIAGAAASDLGMWATQAIFPTTSMPTDDTKKTGSQTESYESYLQQAQEYIDTYHENILDSATFVSEGYQATDYAAYVRQCDKQLEDYVRQLEEWKSSTDITEEASDGTQTVSQDMTKMPRITFMTVLFALLNGFFEEIFFMGLVFAASRKARPWALLFSVLVRFSFHIYQGMPAAVGITCMGLVFMLCRTKIRELVPFTLAHSFFDVFGVTLWFWIYQVIY